MWMPLLLGTVPAIFAHILSGWFIDHYGVKPALVISSSLIIVNSALIMACHSFWAFILLFPSMALGGSLLANSWPTILMKLASPERRPAYFSTVSLAAAPGTAGILLFGMFLVKTTGFDYVFFVSALGGLVSAAIFYLKTPNIRYAPKAEESP
jgi:MFS family permease